MKRVSAIEYSQQSNGITQRPYPDPYFYRLRARRFLLPALNPPASLMDEHQNASELERLPDGEAHDVDRTSHDVNFDSSHPHTGDGASPGKIFIGGLARETTSAQFIKHFGKYGEITDSVIMKDRKTGQPRGFGFVTYADPSVVDRVIEDTHVIHGKQVEIKRTIPRGANSKDFKTKKIFVGGIPTTVGEDEFRDFFSNFGEVKEQQIMRDHSSGRSRGFGFITFESEQSVDDLLANGNRLDFAGTQVEIKKAEPKKPNLPPPPSRRPSNSRAAFGGGYGETYGGYRGGGFGGSGFGSDSYRSGGAYGGRASAYGGYGGGEFGAYGGYSAGSYGGIRADPSLGYSSRFGGGFGRGYDLGGDYGGPGDSYAGYGGGAAGGGFGGGYGGGYDAGFGGGYGGGSGGGALYGSRGGYGGAGSGRFDGCFQPFVLLGRSETHSCMVSLSVIRFTLILLWPTLRPPGAENRLKIAARSKIISDLSLRVDQKVGAVMLSAHSKLAEKLD
ncbi:Heterogeneous nuclear ribonucleoprotein 1 [Sesamum alatum]|uniref:Heterogeneous nuclear ribonucleoprotein 1 n=1 Tax=Sesamum alatum TaxID=300844 RepID=A0AAE1XUF9_9LAMI|nr:Heterogeneous nuclear ribonucleoprotein 1 [Sesamum alatum]